MSFDESIENVQRRKLSSLLRALSDRDFYRSRGLRFDENADVMEQFRQIPMMTKHDLVTDAGTAGVCDLDKSSYVRWHQTSGTTGRPMIVRDTADDWRWWMDCWNVILDAAEITSDDVALMAFSFGPFIGFWSANDALVARGTTVIPGGGLTSLRRAELLLDESCSVLFTTPTYAMRLADVAAEHGLDLSRGNVRRIVVAGEPGGSVPAVRQRIGDAFGAVVFDHAGGSEVGPWGYGNPQGTGMHIIEFEFIAEVFDFSGPAPCWIDPDNDAGETGELVLTPLGRFGCPVLRYRTGDVVQPRRLPNQRFLFLDGGVIGRADDMVVIRGVNIFPSSVEAIVRELCPTSEYRVTVRRQNRMDGLSIELEAAPEQAELLEHQLSSRLAMRVPVEPVAADTLPRFEAKSRRWIDERPK